MSKRNFILLIIILILVGLGIFIFLNKDQGVKEKNTETTDNNFVNQFNPFGNNNTNKGNIKTPVDVSGYVPTPENNPKLKLKKISSVAVAGYGLFTKERLKDVPAVIVDVSTHNTEVNTGNKTKEEKNTTNKKPTPPPTEFAPAIRYASKVGGNIYQTFADKIEERKFAETKIPRIYDAYFINGASSLLVRYLKTDGRTIETFMGTLPKEYLGADDSSLSEVKGTFLPDNIKDISVCKDDKRVFYLFNPSEEKQVGVVLDVVKNKKTQIFESPFTEWLSSWGDNKTITLNTKPASGISGHLYSIDDSGKNLNKVLTNINGLTSLISPDGKSVLYGDDILYLYNDEINTKNVNQLGVRTLPEKCVWSNNDVVYCAVPKSIPQFEYPDSWYQGEVSFRDQIWKIDIKNNKTEMIADPNEIAGEDVDGIKLSLDQSENYLFFINKKDNYLWELSLNQ